MVAVKGKLNSTSNRVTQDSKMTQKASGVKSFKIYPETSKVRTETTRKSIPPSISSILPGSTADSRRSLPPTGDETLYDATTDIKQKTKGVIMMNLEKSKSKFSNTSKLNSQRKVLADISNIRSSFSRSKLRDSPKLVKSKLERIPYVQRVSVSGGIKLGSSSRKSVMGEARVNQIQPSSNQHTLKKTATNREINAISNIPRTYMQDRKSLCTTSKTTGKNLLPPITRKSLPMLKPVIKDIASDKKKEIADKSEKSKGKHGFPVKPKVSRNVVPQPTRPHTRASDGFLVLASKGQTKVDTGALLRKPTKPRTIITTNTVKTQRQLKSKSNSISSLRKSMSSSEVSSKKSDDVPVCSTCNCNNTTEQSIEKDDISKTKALRRKSFTSSLMSRPKVNAKKDILPEIYDERNHLEVTEYVDDIYDYYWVMEAHCRPLKDYLDYHTEITPQMRAILINWLIEVHLKYDLMQETLFLMVTLLDQYLPLVKIKKNEMQLVGLTTLLLASKYEDFWHPRVMDLISISAESYTREQILKMEKDVLTKLKFRLNAPTPYVFMLRFLKAAQLDQKFEHLAFYLIELCLVQYEAINYKPSLLCASAIYLARNTLKLTPTWTPLLAKHARYEESEIRDCAKMILKFHKAAQTSLLSVTYAKYMKHDFNRVAAIKPLNKLPM